MEILAMENLYHQIMLEACKDEESQQWENARHEIMAQSIKETIDHYAKFYYTNSVCEEREK